MMKLANYLEIKTPAVFTVAKLIKLDLFHQRPHLRPTYLSRTFFSFKVFIRPIIRFTMKSPWPEQSKQSRKSKKGDKRRTTEFSKYIYKLQKEDSHPNVVVSKRQASRICERVGAEAARLSKFNKRGTITQREVLAAVRQFQERKSLHTHRT